MFFPTCYLKLENTSGFMTLSCVMLWFSDGYFTANKVGLSENFADWQAEKEKLQQTSHRSVERVLLLAPQQSVPKRRGERRACAQV